MYFPIPRRRLVVLDVAWVLCLSAATTAVFLAVLGPWLLLDDLRNAIAGNHCVVTHYTPCDSGHQALITYWTSPQIGRGAPQHFVGLLDLTGALPRLVSSRRHPEKLLGVASAGASDWLALDVCGSVFRYCNFELERFVKANEMLSPELSNPEELLSLNEGRILALSGSRLFAWDIANHKQAWELPESVATLAANASRSLIVAALTDGRVVEVDTEVGCIRRSIAQFAAPTLRIALSRSGRSLAVVDAGASRAAIFCAEPEMTDWRPVLTNGVPLTDASPAMQVLEFSPDEQFLLTVAGPNGCRLNVWCIAQGTCAAQLNGHASEILGATFRNDEQILSWSTDGTIRQWNLPLKNPRRPLGTALSQRVNSTNLVALVPRNLLPRL